jgi:hypothetical protein
LAPQKKAGAAAAICLTPSPNKVLLCVFKILSEMVMPTQKPTSQIGYLAEEKRHKKGSLKKKQ